MDKRYVVLPVEPTEEMIEELSMPTNAGMASRYKPMCHAAPKPDVVVVEREKLAALVSATEEGLELTALRLIYELKKQLEGAG